MLMGLRLVKTLIREHFKHSAWIINSNPLYEHYKVNTGIYSHIFTIYCVKEVQPKNEKY